MIIALMGTAFSVFVFSSFTSLGKSEALMVGVSVYAVYLFHIFSSAESDIMNPQYEQYATFSEQTGNPNESMSAIIAVVASAMVFIATFLLATEVNSNVWLKLAVVTVALAVFKVITYLSKIKAFYKEKQ